MSDDILTTFPKEVLAEFIRQRLGFRALPSIERDLLYIAWDQQAKSAQQKMDAACERMNTADNAKEVLAAHIDFDRAQKAYAKADRLYKKAEKLERA